MLKRVPENEGVSVSWYSRCEDLESSIDREGACVLHTLTKDPEFYTSSKTA